MEMDMKEIMAGQIRDEMGYNADIVSLYPQYIHSIEETDIRATILINGVLISDVPFTLIERQYDTHYYIRHSIDRNYIDYCLIVAEKIQQYYTSGSGVSLKSIKYPKDRFLVRASFDVFGVEISDIRIYYTVEPVVYCEEADVLLREAILENIFDGYGSVENQRLLEQFVTHMDPDYRKIITEMRQTRDVFDIPQATYFVLYFYHSLISHRVRDDDQEMMIKKMTIGIDNILISVYKPDMNYFRNVDQFCKLSSHYREVYRDLLLCSEKEHKTVLCPTRRIAYYLGHTEPHFRNILFSLFRFEITSLLSLPESHEIVHDIRGLILMKYIMCLLSSSVV